MSLCQYLSEITTEHFLHSNPTPNPEQTRRKKLQPISTAVNQTVKGFGGLKCLAKKKVIATPSLVSPSSTLPLANVARIIPASIAIATAFWKSLLWNEVKYTKGPGRTSWIFHLYLLNTLAMGILWYFPDGGVINLSTPMPLDKDRDTGTSLGVFWNKSWPFVWVYVPFYDLKSNKMLSYKLWYLLYCRHRWVSVQSPQEVPKMDRWCMLSWIIGWVDTHINKL